MSAPSLRQTVEDYLAARSARYSPSTVRNESFVLRRFVTTLAGGRDIQTRNVTAEHVERWFATVLSPHTDRTGTERAPVQASTHNFYRTRIASLHRWAVARGLTRADWLAHVPPMRVPRKVRQQPSPDHLWAMLDSCHEPRDRAVLALAMNTGLRAGEIARLTVGDLDLGTMTLRVWVSKSQVEDDMPVTADLREEMRAWLSMYARAVKRPLHPEDHLVPAMTGPRYRWSGPDGAKVRDHIPSTYVPSKPASKLHCIAKDALEAVGLPTRGEGIHTVRRAVARAYYETLAAEDGHDGAIRVVMTLLHHSNLSTTETYLGVASERRARDTSLRGRSLLPRPTDSQVLDMRPRAVAG
ncbi:tyrosine-type recombinase/integrase [Pedococcus sp. 5OH_020]|uniref:tyrosine-type recombinase/integrase n=1 Tax=Pedococcus sp. 5OH_020 TaxID=2989814 RepID=UPI0022E9A0AC|nr:site-specific integrase [Pedococcus sp. 5OH_020]